MEEDIRRMSWAIVLSSLSVLLAAFIGASSAILAGFLADRRRRRQEDEDRDHDRRLDAYVRMLTACDRVHEGEKGKDLFVELKRSGQHIKLVSHSKEVSDTAERLFLLMAWDTVKDGLPMPSIKDEVRYDTLLSEFYEVARKDLRKPPFRKNS